MSNDASDASPSIPAASTCFSLSQHEWARAWAEVTPGWGGWTVNASINTDDVAGVDTETLFIYPPCADEAAFAILPGLGDTVFLDVLFKDDGGSGTYPSIWEALMVICELSPAQRAGVDALAALATDAMPE
jgi:hypothetical protein